MKTKSLLTALCLPLAFTACTNDEFLSESPTLDARGQIDVVLSAAKPQVGADTRMSIDANNKFVWEKGTDMIGAALVDGSTAISGPLDDKVLVNYPFVADQDGQTSTFSSRSSITLGHYFFYFGYQDVLNRKGLPLGMPAQVYDADSEKSSLQQAVGFMKTISPIVNLSKGVSYEDAQTYNLALKFVNLYTPVRVDIKSSNIPAGVSPKVTKVSLNRDGGFAQNAAANMNIIKGAGIVSLNKNGSIKESERDACVANLETLVLNGSIYNNNQADLATAATMGAYSLEVKGSVELSSAATTSLYILVPKGTVNSLQLVVTTTEGEYTRDITLNNPLTLKDQIQPVEATLNFAQDGSGNVILPAVFNIASTADWNDAIAFMTSHAVGYLNKTASFNLTKNIAINSLPIFNLKITAASAKTLTLNSNFTFTNDNKSQFDFNNVNLAVAEGATLTLNAQPTNTTNPAFYQSITNNGTLIINSSLSNAITNYGTMNVNSDVTLNDALINGRYYDDSDPSNIITEKTGVINISARKVLTMGNTAGNLVGTINIGAGASLDMGNKVLTNTDEIVNNGYLIGTAAVVNAWGTLDNYGQLKAPVTNTNGYVIIEANSWALAASSTITNGTAMVVNVSNFKTNQNDLNNSTKKYQFTGVKVTTNVTNVSEFKAADDNNAGITDIILNGGDWTLAGSYGGNTTKTIEVPANATGLILNGANLALQTALPKNLGVSGTSAVTASAAQSITGNLEVNTGATFTLGANITMNLAVSGNNKYASIYGNTMVQPGAKMYFNTAYVHRNTTLTVKGSSNAAGDNQAVFGVQTTFTNAGTVVSAAKTNSGAGNAGEVSQPTNTATGTFQGNATTIPFS